MTKHLLNDSQFSAVNHRYGPALCYAGPGTGKTTVITHHILFLLETLNVPPEKILVITFTKEAAREMKSRFLTLSATVENSESVNFGTFHSVYLKILKCFLNKDLKVISESEADKVFSFLSDDTIKKDELATLIYGVKSGKSISDFYIENDKKLIFLDKYRQYSDILSQKNLLDFEDILLKTKDFLSFDRSVREEVKSRFSHILIDEFQDINEIQYEILKLISEPSSDIFAVGDENQSIYGFRGSKYGIFNDFMRDFENVSVYELKVNYRSNKSISSAAGKVLGLDLPVTTEEKETHPGFFLRVNGDRFEEERSVIFDLKNSFDEGGSCAVLTRTNLFAGRFKKLWLESIGGEDADLNANTIKNMVEIMLSSIRFFKTKKRSELFNLLRGSFELIPRGYFHTEYIRPEDILRNIPAGPIRDRFLLLKHHIELLNRFGAPGFVTYFTEVASKDFGIGITGEIKDFTDKLETEAEKLKTLNALAEHLENTLKKLNSKEKTHGTFFGNPAFLTFHASKGLEFDNVFIPGVIEGRIPARGIDLTQDIDEERRLLYVAMTRAKKKLFLYTCKKEGSNSVLPSRFIKNLL